MEEKITKEETQNNLITWARRAYNAKMVPGTSGNISVKVGNSIYISTSGSALGDLTKEDIIELNLDGEIVEQNPDRPRKPSSEKPMHIEIYNKRPDIKAIIHIHCPYVTAFAVCKKEMNEPILPEFIYNFGAAPAGAKALRGIPSAKYHLPSSKELAQEIGGYFSKGHNAVLMENHGLVAGAKSLKEAFYALESIQAYAKTYFAAKFLGEINTLTKQEIEEIKNLKG